MMIKGRIARIRHTASWLLLLAAFVALGLALPARSALPQALPDLVVTGISVRPASAQLGQPVTLQATIANQGNAAAGYFYVLFRVDKKIAGAPQVNGLAAGAQTTVQTLWIVTAGRHTLSVEADSSQSVVESNENNNKLSRTLEFSGDLALLSVELSPANPLPGEATTVTATITNSGARDIKKRFAVQFLDGRRAFTTRFISGLAVGAHQVVQASWTPQAGEHVLRVMLDPFNVISESSELNNMETKLIDVSTRRPDGADLQVTQLSLAPVPATAGQAETLTAIVRNHGSGASGPFTVRFQVEGQTLANRAVSPGLKPGTQVTLQVPWTASAGERVIRVHADPEGQVVEPDELDNVLSRVVQVGPPLNACGDYVFYQLNKADMDLLDTLTGLTSEAVRDLFLPGMRHVMEREYQGVNIRFTFKEPPRARSTIRFSTEDRRPILGLAPIGAQHGTAQVFLGSFADFSSLRFAPLDRLEMIIGTVASHELGHLLGLNHTSKDNPNDIMSANADLAIFSLSGLPSFTSASLQQLERELPLACSR